MHAPPQPSAQLRPALLVLLLLLAAGGCQTPPRPGTPAQRTGDEIMAAGHLIHAGTPVVLWSDPGGYDAYRVERRFSPFEQADWAISERDVKNLETPNRYGLRKAPLRPEEIEQVRGGGWTLPQLQAVVDQFVLHFDACGTSRECFRILHDHRGLSAHFLLDLDGTLYQTLDLKERAWHATTSNTRSVGIEIAHIGAYRADARNPQTTWYHPGTDGRTRLVLPARLGDGGLRTTNFVGHPARNEPIRGNIQGSDLVQYDFTPEQYAALIKLTATLSQVFPKLRCDYPRDGAGQVLTRKLPDDQLRDFTGVLAHFHIQTDKVDPGPAFQWDKVIGGARQILNPPPPCATPRSQSAKLP